MPESVLILDLDDTIFETKTIDPSVFNPFFNDFIPRLEPLYAQTVIKNISDDLWCRPFDTVIKKYNIPKSVITNSLKVMDNLNFNLTISVYPDYSYLRNSTYKKFLVTTGLKSLQSAKIAALGIEADFIKIVINDSTAETRTKQDIFTELLNEFTLTPELVYVIGDNPESEIKAGNALSMQTIQILRNNIQKGDNAKHYIRSFFELEKIIN